MRGLTAYKRKLAELTKLSAQVTTMRRKLAARCEHPPEFVEDYEWEHDNGYGRQTRHNGKQCRICGGKDLYPALSGGIQRPREAW